MEEWTVVQIAFPPHERGDERRRVISFPALIEGRQVECAVSYQTLWLHFGAGYNDPLPAFMAHRQRIEQVAAQCIREARFEDDGTVMIRSQDITPDT